ncbi:MAG: hypothetical protein JW984_01820 [Deltaproteobacteria bacterium]|uniref:Uncharacterized protein n=1 Tax=Candidatus Zymogenus saltonus TaxID=2844893 RepID=A0A9D8KBJ0_9DELT|nr:hypothetical protein [Candidatus Zymogenus saltonus]
MGGRDIKLDRWERLDGWERISGEKKCGKDINGKDNNIAVKSEGWNR